MGVDTVSLSTKNNMYTVYKDWRYSDTKLTFKDYLLEDDERIKAFANSFKKYNSGDMFTKETVMELEDGRLLCFDPDEFSKAYLIDLSDVTKEDINFDMETDFKMIKADKSKSGYETRNSAILSYLGDDIKTKDGQTLDVYLSKRESSDDLTQVDNNRFYYTNIAQMSNDEEEQEYYRYVIESLGGLVDNNGTITKGKDSALLKLNDKINQFETYMSKGDDQNKLNALILLQKLGLSELELIEKLTPGFLESVKSFIGEYEEISYTDDNGFQSSGSQNINFKTVMTYKYNNSDKYWMYLSLEDREACYSEETQTFLEDGGNNKNTSIVKAAKSLTKLSSATRASLESTMEANLEQRVSDRTIEAYIDDFLDFFSMSDDGKCTGLANGHTYDEALEYIAMLCTENVSGEILYYLLQDSRVQQCLVNLGVQKGTLATEKTADKPAEEQLTVQAVYTAMAEKVNSYVEETFTVMGDKERIEMQKALDGTIWFLDAAAGGINVKYNENGTYLFLSGLGQQAVMQAGLAVWANREANAIVEKSTTKMLENAGDAARKTAKDAADIAAKEAKEKYLKEVEEKAIKEAKEKITKKYDDTQKAFNNATDEFKKARRNVAHLRNELKQAKENYGELDEKYKKINKKFEEADKKFEEAKKTLAGKRKEFNKAKYQYENQDFWSKGNANMERINAATDAEEAAEKARKEVLDDAAKPFNNASNIKEAKKTANDAADAYKQAQKGLNELDVDKLIKNQTLDKTKDKDLIEKLKKLKKGDKTVKFSDTELDTMDKITTNDGSTLKNKWSKLTKAKQGADDAQDALDAAKKLRAKAKSGVVDNINDNLKLNRYKAGQREHWWQIFKADSPPTSTGSSIDNVAEKVGKSLNVDADGVVKLADEMADDLADGVKNVSKSTAKKTTSKATTTTKALRLGGVLSKAFMTVDCVSTVIDGGEIGYGIASWLVEKNEQNFIDPTTKAYDTTRANVAKGFGAAAGAFFGLAAGMWTSGLGASINAATGSIAGTVVGVVAGALGLVCAGVSAAACFTKWFK